METERGNGRKWWGVSSKRAKNDVFAQALNKVKRGHTDGPKRAKNRLKRASVLFCL